MPDLSPGLTPSDEDRHLTDSWPVAPGHELPQDVWDQVVASAAEIAARESARGLMAPSTSPTTLTIGDPNGKNSGLFRRTPPQLVVIHTAECPLRTGFAESLTRWGATSDVEASWHRMSDPATVALFVSLQRIAWHATIANPISIGYEQAGYAAFPRATWLTPDGLASISRLARQIVLDGIPAAAVRRLTDDEVRRALAGDTSITGICAHAQIQPRDRTDPGAGYPWDVLLDFIRQYHPSITSQEEDPFMALTDAEQRELLDRIRKLPAAILDAKVDRIDPTKPADPKTGKYPIQGQTSLRQELSWIARNVAGTRSIISRLTGKA